MREAESDSGDRKDLFVSMRRAIHLEVIIFIDSGNLIAEDY
jgi:hypothetical protein